jgi:hypothetical protein
MIMKNSIKLGRVKKATGKLPMAFEHILKNIPESVLDALTSKQIAELVQSMDKHFNEGRKQELKEVEEFIGLPNGVNIWQVIGDKDYLGIHEFTDGLHIPNILQSRGRQVATWETAEAQ